MKVSSTEEILRKNNKIRANYTRQIPIRNLGSFEKDILQKDMIKEKDMIHRVLKSNVDLMMLQMDIQDTVFTNEKCKYRHRSIKRSKTTPQFYRGLILRGTS